MDILRLGIFILITVIYGSFSAKSQVEIIASPEINKLLEQHISSNKALEGKQKGYRVQIFFDSGNNSRQQAIGVRNEFASRYPRIKTYITFKEPNFRVRVGDFRTRSNARGFQQHIAETYPQSFVVKDDISYPKYTYERKK
ncbi:MAG: SPOR domain-containing protein [Bacteroidales bacterium]|nr:SPOR domain-containing protein [Bacteroidales bacterium]